MEIYFADRSRIREDRIELDEFERNHLRRVLRKESGETLFVTDGQGLLYEARIESTSPRLLLTIINRKQKPRSRPDIMLAIGFIRPNRLEFVFEKGCELGVSKFYLVKTRYANYFSSNTVRYEKVLRQAVKQSGNLYLPEIVTTESIEHLTEKIPDTDLLLAALDPTEENLLSAVQRNYSKDIDRLLIFIGPEGGFSDEEAQNLRSSGFLPVALGTNRLRAETAAVTGISVLQLYINQQKEKAIGT